MSIKEAIDQDPHSGSGANWNIFRVKIINIQDLATLKHKDCGNEQFPEFNKDELDMPTECPECNGKVLFKDLLTIIPQLRLQDPANSKQTYTANVVTGNGNVNFVQVFLPKFKVKDIYDEAFPRKVTLALICSHKHIQQ